MIGEILHYVKEKEATYAELERKLSTNPNSVRDNCKILENLGLIKIRTEKHQSNNKKAYKVSITEEGAKAEKKLEKE